MLIVEAPEDHFGIVILFSDRSLRFMDLYDVKLITLSQGVPGDHLNGPGLTAGFIPYEKGSAEHDAGNHADSNRGDDDDGDADSENSESDSLSVKRTRPDALGDDDDSGKEYQLKPTIIRCGGALSKKEGAEPSAFVDVFDIERVEWRRIEQAMHCRRVYAQSLIINGKLVVVGGECFEGDTECSLIEEYDFERKCWDKVHELKGRIWMHSACAVYRGYNSDVNTPSYDGLSGRVTEIFIGGGFCPSSSKFVADCMLYDTATNKLDVIAPLKSPRSCATAICFDFGINGVDGDSENRIYVIGGHAMDDDPRCAKRVEAFDLSTRQWVEVEDLLFDHGFWPSVWIQNVSDFTQKRSKEEKERLKRINQISNNAQSGDPPPVFTVFVAGNGCHGDGMSVVEYLEPQSRKWKVLKKEVGDIQLGKVQSIKKEVFCARKFTSYSIRDDVLDSFQRQQAEQQKYAIMDEL